FVSASPSQTPNNYSPPAQVLAVPSSSAAHEQARLPRHVEQHSSDSRFRYRPAPQKQTNHRQPVRSKDPFTHSSYTDTADDLWSSFTKFESWYLTSSSASSSSASRIHIGLSIWISVFKDSVFFAGLIPSLR